MEKTPELPELLRLIDGRSAAFRAAVGSAPSLDVPVPTCPEWTLFDLAQHLGQGRRFWDAAVATDRGCWTWWGTSQSPGTCAAVARHQLQEVAVHTYDAQLTLGAPEPLPDEVALDGVEEFLSTCCATTDAWPHEPAAVDYHATEGRSWRLSLSADGARTARLPGTGTMPEADASLRGTAGELVLALYGRVPVDSLKLDGERRIFDQLLAWDPA
ncbi:maleylpyruvate isomerase N-terminal domain-containing protein [Streptomyces sp. NPDC048417]|uniref:maleylpyruvate isomerase N-terminal domain-containing protein n=1 Tax=Streptomyces sp. NPDC048417 TaxID=3155387 RepID=UPI00341438FE